MSLNPTHVKAHAHAIGQAPRPTFDDGKPLVLLVEDHDDTRFMLRIVLERSGCRVTEAADGAEAIKVACLEQPDLILMDGSLPRLSGLEATRRLRKRQELDDVPIVALSGHATPEFRAAALAAGCDDCLFKPIVFDQLESLISRLFHTSQYAA